ncbi:MAG: hypothetical protein Q4B94_01840 [Pseudomonadota bacterium]|nr:hypothetical protein [Pseudomonadota bacterium]
MNTNTLPAAGGLMGYFISEDDHRQLSRLALLARFLADTSKDAAITEAAECVASAAGGILDNAIFGSDWVDMGVPA